MGSLKQERRGLAEDCYTSNSLDNSDAPDVTQEGCGSCDIMSLVPKRPHNSPAHQPHDSGSPSTGGGEEAEDMTGARGRGEGTTRPGCGDSVPLDSIYLELSSGPAAEWPQVGSASEDKQPGLPGSTDVEDPDISQTALQKLPMTDPSYADGGRREEKQERSKERKENEEKDAEGGKEKEMLWKPSVEPCSPASPARQQHMQTQVSLEVVQCHSVATSPMTPPQGGAGFYFPYSTGRPGDVGMETKDAELQVGRQVEYRSVATAPMTPKTPTALEDFPEISGRERGKVEERSEEKRMEERAEGEQMEHESPSRPESDPTEVYPHLALAPALRCTTPKKGTKEIASDSQHLASHTPGNSTQTELAGSSERCHCEAEETVDDMQQQHLPRMETMNQDITILVTHHDSPAAEEEEGEEQNESSIYSDEPEMSTSRSHECEEMKENVMDVLEDSIEVKGSVDNAVHSASDGGEDMMINDLTQKTPPSDKNSPPVTLLPSSPQPDKNILMQKSSNQTKQQEQSGAEDKEAPCSSEETGEGSRSPPARKQHMQTQVSLEVVQCHSVATSPMTPPQGGTGFFFPCPSGRTEGVGMETKDAELQVGRQVEFRSVATAPMTPRTPTFLETFPEISSEESGQTEERKLEEENMKDRKEQRMKENITEDAETNIMTEEKTEQRLEGRQEGEKEGGSEQRSSSLGCPQTGLPSLSTTNNEQRSAEKTAENTGDKAKERTEERQDKKEEKIEQKEGGTEEKSEVKVEEKLGQKAGGKAEEKKSEERAEDEVVQEVRWDEMGMTWEVYGAVVEVAVLGSAIQKHLEKQVKKHRKQPSSSLPPPPPLSLTATPLPSTPPPPTGVGTGQGEPGKGRGGRRGERGRRRRNPFRLLLQNMQQPHCCSRAHTAE